MCAYQSVNTHKCVHIYRHKCVHINRSIDTNVCKSEHTCVCIIIGWGGGRPLSTICSALLYCFPQYAALFPQYALFVFPQYAALFFELKKIYHILAVDRQNSVAPVCVCVFVGGVRVGGEVGGMWGRQV